ncbi:ClbS/DfsB family four-helix bundle protein [uncultured Roseobacter sp.]|uniref:ClbS/DfsB family four-helix bundle protein n=1 Tax=uncultured Roseobacter sp. TaxID=114847 RepID=UPI0026106529|nr:ClbS/DfsB family four-helix bundle protein [uncultured Roseobacter sp.]
MAAQNKTELLDITRKEYAKLQRLVTQIEEPFARRKDDEDTSVRDVIAHRAHWIDLFLGWYHDGLAGKPVFFPAEGYKWNELKRYNAELRRKQAHMSWDDACRLLQERYEALTRFLDEHSETELYGSPMKGANNNWTTGRWVEAAGPSHFRSAAKYIRARLRAAG